MVRFFEVMSRGCVFTRSVLAVVVLLFAARTYSSPQIIRIDGSLFNAGGAPVSGNRDIQVKAYDAATGGSAIWTSSVYNTAVTDGRFSVALDGSVDTVSLTKRIADKVASGEVWFEIIYDTGTANGTMNSPVTMSSRIRGRGSMFALAAASADSLNGVSATVAEMNRLAGITTNIASLLNGLTANIQTQLNNKATLPVGAPSDNQVLKFDTDTGVFYWDNDAGASGGVSGSGGTSANALARWNGTGGTTIKGTGIIVDDTDNVSGVAGLTAASINVTGASASRVLLTDSVKNLVSASNIDATELNYLDSLTAALAANLNGLTANVQTQLNSKLGAADVSGKADTTAVVAKNGDTMTGGLGLSYANATPDRAAYLDSNRVLRTSANVDSTELEYLDGLTSSLSAKLNPVTSAEVGYLSGVTSNLGAKINLVTTTELSRLAGVTGNVQTQINAILGGGAASGRIDRTGDSMTGGLGLDYTGASADGVVVTDSARILKTSSVISLTELGYLDSLTAALAPNLNGLTANVQTQLNTKLSATDVSGKLDKGADTMTGNLGLNYANATPDRAAYLDANRVLRTSANVSSSELEFLDGVTSSVSKINSFTATEAGYLTGLTTGLAANINGLTANVQTQLNSKLVAADIAGKADTTAVVAKNGDSMTGNLTLLNQGEVRFAEATGTGSNYIAFRAPSNLTADRTFTWPSAAPANNQVLKVDTSTNTFYWDNDAGASGGVSGPGASTANAIARWNGTGGTTIKDSNIIVSDTDTISGIAGLTAASINVTGATASRVLLTDSAKNLVSASNIDATELDYLDGLTAALAGNLNGLTANVQTQLNSKLVAGDIAGKLDKGADTMTGNLGLNYANATPDRAAYLDSNRVLRTSANVDSTELDYLDGVTSNIGAKLNLVSTTEMGRLAGVTGNVQTQINAILGGGAASGRIDRTGDSMTGGLGLDYAGASADGVVVTDSARLLKTSTIVDLTELGYLDGLTSSLSAKLNPVTDTEVSYLTGLTSNIGAKINKFTVTEAGYLSGLTAGLAANLNGLTANVQSQLNTKLSATDVSGKLDKGADTMTGNLGLAGGAIAATNKALILNASRQIATSATSDTELGYLSGVTSTVSKINSFTATEATYLSGLTAGLAANLNGLTANVQSQINNITTSGAFLAKGADTMTGNLGLAGAAVSPSRALFVDAARKISTGNTTDTELGYLNGVTSTVSKINSFTATEATYLSGVTTNLGAKLNPVTTTEIGYLSGNTANIGGKLNLVTATELGYLAGVTYALPAKLNGVTVSLAPIANALQGVTGVVFGGYLNGLTANVQSQINNITTGGAFVNKGADTMTGNLGFNYANATPDRAAYLDSNRVLRTSANVDSSELEFLDGVTSNIGAKINKFTATEAGYLTGLTTGLAANLNGLTANVQTQLNTKLSATDVSGKLDKGADTMTGNLGLNYANATPDRAAYLDSNRVLRTSANVDSTELEYLDGVTSSLSAKLNPVTSAEVGYLSGVTSNLGAKINLVTTTELSRLAGVTGNVQTQINAILGGGAASGRIDRTGDSMTGGLGLDYTGASADGVVVTDSARILKTSSTISLTELGYLDSLTAALAPNLNGLTANVQTQLNTKLSATDVSGKLDKGADTMTGNLGLNYANATPDRAAYLDSNRVLRTSANVDSSELEFLDGVTSNIGAKINKFTVTEAGYLSGLTTGLAANLNGLTANVQTQLNAKLSAADVSGKLDKGADTMTGDLGLAGSAVPTTNRVLYLDATRKIATAANVDATELDYLDGVTSTVSKINSFTATEATYLSGLTTNLGTKLNPVTTAEIGYLVGNTASIGSKLNGVTVNLTPIANALQSVTGTALGGYLNGLTANVQSQINNISSGGAFVAKVGDTMTGPLGVSGGVNITNAAGTLSIGGFDMISVGTGYNSGNQYYGQSPSALTSGMFNVAMGYQSGQAISTGVRNTMLGNGAGKALWGGSYNTFVGNGTGIYTTTGMNNTFIGSFAGQNVSTRANNTFVGYQSNDTSGTASQATGIGYQAVVTAGSAVQLGTGTNSTANSLQFNGYNFLNDSGAATFASVNGVTTNGLAANLNGLTANVQTQLNAKLGAADVSGKLDKGADTMTGNLGLAGAAIAATNKALILNASRQVATSTTSDTELGYLSGVTSTVSKINSFTATEATYLSGLTTNLGTKLNPVTTAEIGYLVGNTASIGSKLNGVTVSLAPIGNALQSVTGTALGGYLNGLTNNVQTQLNAKLVAADIASKLDTTAGGTMTGNFGLNYTNATPDRAAYLDSNRVLRTSASVDSTELDYLDGVTSSLSAKVNKFTATEAGYISGITASLSSQLNGVTTSLAPMATAFQGVTGAVFGGYVNGLTANIQTQLNAGAPMGVIVLTGSTTAVAGKAYITNSASLVGVTLPTNCVVGDRFQVIGLGAGGWRVYQGSGQQIDYSGGTSTSGTTGYLKSVNTKAAVELLCRVTNTNWQVSASDGIYTADYLTGVSTYSNASQTTSALITTLTVPANVRQVTIQAWGGGGGGGGANAYSSATVYAVSGGGGGAAYSTGTYSVVPGDILNIIVAGGGAGGATAANTGAGGGGGYTMVSNNGAPLVVAGGGGGGGVSTVSVAAMNGGGGGGGGGAPGSCGANGDVGYNDTVETGGSGACGPAGGLGGIGSGTAFYGLPGSTWGGGGGGSQNWQGAGAGVQPASAGGAPGGGNSWLSIYSAGGGGGGGWGGGGGGGGSSAHTTSAGGGGGSSLGQSGTSGTSGGPGATYAIAAGAPGTTPPSGCTNAGNGGLGGTGSNTTNGTNGGTGRGGCVVISW